MEGNLKNKAISGVFWSSLQRFGKMGIAFIVNLIMARLLMPEDYGAIGILMVFISLSLVFIDSGFANALIQRPSPTERDYSTIFFFNIAVSGGLYVILYLTAPYIASFYNNALLVDLLRVIGLVLIVDALAIIQDCRMRKQMNFKMLSIASITAAIIGGIVGIVCAYNGAGVWSLVIYSMTESTARAVILWAICRWFPSFTFSKDSLKTLFAFGGFLLANSLLVTLRRNAMAIVLGKLYTARDLGMYSQAKKLEDVPVTSTSAIIGQVTFPLFSKIQDNSDSLKNVQRKSLSAIAFITIPLLLLIMVIAKPLIVFLYTEKWAEAAPYLQILCFVGIFASLQEVSANVTNAMGASRLFFMWSFIKTVFFAVLIYGGSFFGIRGLLAALVINELASYVINALLAAKFSHYTLWEQIRDFSPIAIASLIASTVSWIVCRMIDGNLITLIVTAVVFVITYFASYYIIDRKTLKEYIGYIHK